jgi:hypothetical protein
LAILIGLFLYLAACTAARAGENPSTRDLTAKAEAALSRSQPITRASIEAAGIESYARPQADDPCFQIEVVSSPSRPYWDSGATTTQCGILETDFGWLRQPMGDGVKQWILASSIRYGLTPRMDLRWGLTNHIAQWGGSMGPRQGSGDQSVSATYRFHDEGRWLPGLALSYRVKIPTASPAKGLGTGHADHQFLFIASGDLGQNHLDFNIAGTLTGSAHGNDGAAQFGLAMTRQLTKKFAGILESYGGPQPGTGEKYGAVLGGGSFCVRSWFVLDGAYVRAYADGSPRQQTLIGLTYAMRPGFTPIPKKLRLARWLGR